MMSRRNGWVHVLRRQHHQRLRGRSDLHHLHLPILLMTSHLPRRHASRRYFERVDSNNEPKPFSFSKHSYVFSKFFVFLGSCEAQNTSMTLAPQDLATTKSDLGWDFVFLETSREAPEISYFSTVIYRSAKICLAWHMVAGRRINTCLFSCFLTRSCCGARRSGEALKVCGICFEYSTFV